MARLWQVAKLVRSKNAGPFALTFDIMFDDPGAYHRCKELGILSRAAISSLYRVLEKDIQLFHVDNALAIKFSIPRPVSSGDLGDTDIFGGQQYAPLLDIEVPDKV